jgi:DNA-binding protein HU-beta
VNKGELVDKVARAADVEKRKAEAAVDALVKAIVDATRSGERVSIFGFGTFSRTARAARVGRNPQTGAPVQIAASKGVKFSPASAYKSALNPRAGKKAAGGKKAAPKKASAKKSAARKTVPSSKKR